MKPDADYGECQSCNCDGLFVTFRQLVELGEIEAESTTVVFRLPDGRIICAVCYAESREQLLSGVASMLAWEAAEMQKTDKLEDATTNNTEYYQ